MSEERQNQPLSGMYADYFLDYASYVILERAVPHINDGLKPVQRRILHSMKELDDGRYNKVANIVGNTMKYHPHGDASIGDAMTQIGQKNLLIDPQGNWGNVLTGDRAAAPRYIEARLTPFALEVVYSPKVTEWTVSYDGRNQEPVTFPVKFPLLLEQGVEGIAVGMACKILPHNFNELIDASVAILRNQEFTLVPDFMTGGIMDASDYRDGLRGGKLRVRARIEVVKARVLCIKDLPFGVTTSGLMDSIISAADKSKIKISKIEDHTAAEAEIFVYLPAGTDSDQMVEALYAFTDCEVSISPNSAVIRDGKPYFLGVSDILRHSTERTKELLLSELEIKLGELNERWHHSSLEKIFIENRIYRDIEEAETWEEVLANIDQGLEPFKPSLKRDVTADDLAKLTEIRIKRISKFDSFKADELIKGIEKDIEQTEKNIRNLTRFTIRYFEQLKKKYGKGKERQTELSSFQKVDRTKVAVASETLYIDRKTGFAGTSLKKEEALEKCSQIDDILVISKEGILKVVKVSAKFFVGKNPLYIGVLKKGENDGRVFSMVYRDGRDGSVFAKRFQVGGHTRDKEYPLTQGTTGSRIFYFSWHDTDEESKKGIVLVYLKSSLKLRNLARPYAFAQLAIKGRASKGNLVTKHSVDRIVNAPKDFLKEPEEE